MTLPETTADIGIGAQDHVEVRACLQITQKTRDICKAVEGTSWWSWTIIKDKLEDRLAPIPAGVCGKNYGLRVFGID